MPILMRNQPLQLENNKLIYLLTREKEGKLLEEEAMLLEEWKSDHAVLAQRIKSWNNKAMLQQLLEQYADAAGSVEGLWARLQEKIRTEKI